MFWVVSFFQFFLLDENGFHEDRSRIFYNAMLFWRRAPAFLLLTFLLLTSQPQPVFRVTNRSVTFLLYYIENVL